MTGGSYDNGFGKGKGKGKGAKGGNKGGNKGGFQQQQFPQMNSGFGNAGAGMGSGAGLGVMDPTFGLGAVGLGVGLGGFGVAGAGGGPTTTGFDATGFGGGFGGAGNSFGMNDFGGATGGWGNAGYGGFGNGYGNGFENGGLGANLATIQWGSEQLVPVMKNFYFEHPMVAARTPAEVAALRQQHNLTVVSTGEGDFCPNPIATFQEANFPDYIMNSIMAAGFQTPSAIQAQGWPIALSGRDMIGIAETGSGKTLAFLLPAVVHINAQEPLRHGDGPIALVLAPTRELAVQIGTECDKFCKSSGLRTVCVYGGGGTKGQQIRELRQGREVVVATPGRLIDLLEGGHTTLKRVTYLCLDEADRMLDMGFEDQVRKICSQIRPDRQTLLWSATWPRSIQHLAKDLCKESPIHISVGNQELKANKRIAQFVEVLTGADWQVAQTKQERLLHLMGQLNECNKDQKIIIFSGTKRGCEQLTKDLRRLGNIGAACIHGDKEQRERDWALQNFRDGRCPVLVATDVAARGLDVKEVRVVINFDMPSSVEDYVHRIGRTGRAGEYGSAYTFFSASTNGKMARELVDILKGADQQVPPELLSLAASNKGGHGKGRGRFGGGKGKGKGKGKGHGKGKW